LEVGLGLQVYILVVLLALSSGLFFFLDPEVGRCNVCRTIQI
jgi:hypothetical protein